MTGRVFSSLDEAVRAYDERFAAEPTASELSLHGKIKVRMPAARFPEDIFPRHGARTSTPQSIVLSRVRQQR